MCLECLENEQPEPFIGDVYRVRWYTLFLWVVRAIKAETRIRMVQQLHSPRNGICPECVTRYPCKTAKAFNRDWYAK